NRTRWFFFFQAEDGIRYRPGRKLEQISVQVEISRGRFKLGGVVQSYIDSGARDGGLLVHPIEAQEGIEGRSRVGIQECFSQARGTDNSFREIYRLIPGITETQ